MTSPKRILVLAGGGLAHTSGGVGTLMRYLIESWRSQNGPHVRVIDTRGQGGGLDGAAHFAAAIWHVLHHAAAGELGLVHAHMTTRGSVLRKCTLCGVAMAFRVPVIMHMHGADFFPFYLALPRFSQAIIRAVLQRCHSVIVLGQAWQDFLRDQMKLAPSRIAIVPNGVPAPALPQPPHPDGTARILFLGRIGTRKGVPDLIAALASPGLCHAAWHAVIAGDGELHAARAQIREARLESKIDVPGWTDRNTTNALLAAADILVLPSYHEAMPIAILEALASKVAVIATPVGAIPEFLANDVNAILVAPGNVAELAAAIADLLQDPTRRARLAAAGQALFQSRFTITAMSQKIAALYDSALTRTQNRKSFLFLFFKKEKLFFVPTDPPG
jgi:glycosyltransferase involved in cell wall biosynthesis